MGKLVIVALAILTVLKLSEAKTVVEKIEDRPKTKVFQLGIYPTTVVEVSSETSSSSPPTPTQIYTPNVTYTYPVFLFLHDTCLENSWYSSVLRHIASHGFIVVAPQLYSCDIFLGPISGTKEVAVAANVTNWLSQGLASVLPGNVKANLQNLATGGHGRGGKTAFALALGHSPVTLNLQYSGLIGVDPVAGSGKGDEDDPQILTYVPESFDLSIPATVIGTGYGNQTNWCLICPVCAPNDVNHVEFYSESIAPVSHIVAEEYGHVDMLDDELEGLMGFVANIKCKNGEGSKDGMRKTVGGIIVAFFNAYFGGFDGDYMSILHNPTVAPISIGTPEFKFDEDDSYAQI